MAALTELGGQCTLAKGPTAAPCVRNELRSIRHQFATVVIPRLDGDHFRGLRMRQLGSRPRSDGQPMSPGFPAAAGHGRCSQQR